MAFKYLLPTLALAGSAVAQCGTGGSFTIQSSADTTQIQNCVTYRGDIIIDPAVTGTIAINGVRTISGDLRCANASNLNTISADQLQSIGGALDLQEIQVLSTLQMDYLTSVGSINFIGLPNLQTLQFTRGVSTADSVYISNTNLRDLKGIELTMVSSMDINNNVQLDTVNVNSMTNVTTALSFAANGPNLNVMLPNLIGAANLTFRAVSSVTIPSLYEVPGYVGFYEDTFNNVSAPNLTRVGQTLAIVGNPNLVDVSFPKLNLVRGGLIVANNTNLDSIEGFPLLSKIGGAIDLYGGFESADLPGLTDVRGAATIITKSTNGSICDSFYAYKNKSIIAGKVSCLPNTDDPTATNGTNSTSSGKKSAAASVSPLSSMAVTAVVAFAAAFFCL